MQDKQLGLQFIIKINSTCQRYYASAALIMKMVYAFLNVYKMCTTVSG